MGKYTGLHPNDDAGHAMYEEQRTHGGPDPNPYIPCAECGDRYAFQDYWEPRYVEPEDRDPHEDRWLCDACEDWERRAEENHAVTEWVG